jgi:hypothetical protein
MYEYRPSGYGSHGWSMTSAKAPGWLPRPWFNRSRPKWNGFDGATCEKMAAGPTRTRQIKHHVYICIRIYQWPSMGSCGHDPIIFQGEMLLISAVLVWNWNQATATSGSFAAGTGWDLAVENRIVRHPAHQAALLVDLANPHWTWLKWVVRYQWWSSVSVVTVFAQILTSHVHSPLITLVFR